MNPNKLSPAKSKLKKAQISFPLRSLRSVYVSFFVWYRLELYRLIYIQPSSVKYGPNMIQALDHTDSVLKITEFYLVWK